MRKFWNELLLGKHPAVIAFTGGLIALFTIVPIFSANMRNLSSGKMLSTKLSLQMRKDKVTARRTGCAAFMERARSCRCVRPMLSALPTARWWTSSEYR